LVEDSHACWRTAWLKVVLEMASSGGGEEVLRFRRYMGLKAPVDGWLQVAMTEGKD
jgi:hypothetical protein